MPKLLSFALLLFSLPVFAQDPCDELQIGFTHAPHPNGLQFTDQSAYLGAVTWYQWSFGDGSVSFVQNPVHGYAINGTYEVCLTIGITMDTPDGPVNCLDSYCQMVEYSEGGGFSCAQYTASFEYEILEGNTVVVYSTSEPFGGDHIWQFGDGETASGQQSTHTYDSPGEYTICQVSYIWNGVTGEFCFANSCQTIIVGALGLDCDLLFATFTATLQSGTTMVFEQTTDPTANTFDWDLGDNTTAQGPVVTHTYAGPGTYQVCMGATWWDDLLMDSCWANICETFHILDPNLCDPGFQVEFGWSHVDGTAYFQGTSTLATGFLWDMGDGQLVPGEMLEHLFENEGEYPVCLLAWYLPSADADTCWAESCSTIIIGPGSTSCDDLQVAFDHESIAAGVQFTNDSYVPGVPYSLLWEFGDGGSSMDAAPLHAYAALGEYEVCLTIMSLIGDPGSPDTCTATQCTLVIWEGAIGDPCLGYESAFTGTAGGPLEMIFASTTDPQGNGFFWEFGDGGSATGEEVAHIYGASGNYEVCLTTWWWNEAEQDTCWSTLCQYFNVAGEIMECDTAYAIDFTWQQSGDQITFTALPNMASDGIIWFFGDGTNGAGGVVTHSYAPPGPYTVCVTAWYWNATTQDSCWAEQCQVVDLFVGVDELRSAAALRIYPRPAHDQLTIDAAADTPLPERLLMFTVDGRLVKQDRVMGWPHRMSVGDLSPGTYLLRLDHRDQVLVERIVVE